MTLREYALAYLENPGPENLSALRQQIRAAGNYRSDVNAEAVAVPLLESGDYEAVIRELHELMPGAFFSPVTHQLLATAYDSTGQTSKAQDERTLARAATDSILSTGDGTADSPWSVLRVSDEYDVLRATGHTSQSQSLVHQGGRVCDRHECADGSVVWFDITDFRAKGSS